MLFNFAFVGLDAVRDAWLKERKPGVSRQAWHIIKQISFYGFEALIISALYLAGLIPLTWQAGVIGIVYVVMCWKLWRVCYKENK